MNLTTIMTVAAKTLTSAAEAGNVPEVTETVAKTANASKANPMINIIYFGALIAFSVYYLVLRPKKMNKEKKDMLEALGVGDTVVTTSGIKGKITGEEEEFFVLKVDKNTSLTILKNNIIKKYN